MMISFNYLFQKFHIQPKGVIHLGASIGQEMETYRQFKMSPVVFVEAIPSVFEQLKKNVSAYPEVICINECIGDEDGKTVFFNVSNNEAQSSSYLELEHHAVIHPTVHYVEVIKMATKTVSTIVKEHNLDISQFDFLNCDLQGVELLALKGMKDLLSHFKWLYLEVNKVHVYRNCALVEEIDEYVRKWGFERVETGNWVADSWTDALYQKQ
jgi:FkbM family methyltransferase